MKKQPEKHSKKAPAKQPPAKKAAKSKPAPQKPAAKKKAPVKPAAEKPASPKSASNLPAALPPPDEPLRNLKHEMFCLAYIKHRGVGSRAVAEAGYSAGSCKTMHVRLLARPEVMQRIQHLSSVMLEGLHSDAKATLEEIARLAFIDAKAVVKKAGHKKVLDGETPDGKKLYKMVPFVELHDWDLVDGTLIKEIGVRQGSIYVKLHDRTDFLRILAQYHGIIGPLARKKGDDEPGEDTGDDDKRAKYAILNIVLNQFQTVAADADTKAAVAKVLQLVEKQELNIEDAIIVD